ncbi:MAG: primosomal protein N' [Acidobacteriota bacterium]
MSRRVEVAVPVPLRKTFTYAWPENGPLPLPGVRVRVPFGRRRMTGVVVGESTGEAGAGTGSISLRPIEEVLDDLPLLLPSMLEMARFVADYYVAPIGEVLKLFLPPGKGAASRKDREKKRVVEVRCTDRLPVRQVAEMLRRAPAQQRAFRRVKELGGRASPAQLAREGIKPGILKALAARSLVTLFHEPVPRAGLPEGLLPATGTVACLLPEQKRAVQEVTRAVRAGGCGSFLLRGVTGSGKTEVYLRAAMVALQEGRGALILVPEIGLTPALLGRLRGRVGDRLAVLHSGLSPRLRRVQWDRIRRGEAKVVIGARSALFAPLADPGLIVVDEEQDTSYKQEENPRYQARDLALVRGRLQQCPVLLVSATPSLESAARAAQGRHGLLILARRVQGRALPRCEIVDLRREFREVGRMTLLSRRLVESIRENHAAGGQTMLLFNRRGWAAFILCRACGEPVICGRCSVSLTYHRNRECLLCHYCGFTRAVVKACPSCGEEAVQEMGAGTEKVEEEMARLFPDLRLLRMDADSLRQGGGHARLLARFARGEADMLLGTQIIAKGHDFPGVTLVGILGGDALLAFPDFRAAEWTFQLATQAAGRAGRGREPGQVILQAFRPDHYALQRAREHDYPGFYQCESRFRRALLYPPHAVLAAVRVQHRDCGRGASLIRRVEGMLRADPDAGEQLRILGPAPAPLSRLRGRYRFHLLLKSLSRRRLTAVLQRLGRNLEAARGPARGVSIDVDPVSIL